MVENGASDDDKVNEEPPPLPLWQEIQKRTFTNWVNLRLSPSFINDLFVDLSNGLQLIKLIENLTERNLGRRNKRIEHVNQRLDNVSIALDFLHEKEGLNLTNIGPADIVGGNPKLILGLMWLLFRQYTIAKALPMLPHEIGQKPNDKARLLQWIRSKLPGTFPLSNLTSDWNDGFALAALVEGCVPGLNAGWKDWDPTTPLENTKKAMDLAKEHLGIDRMIAPEDLISSDVDEISVMAYLTNFPLMVEAKKSRGSLKNIDRHPISGIRSAFEVRLLDPTHTPHVAVRKTDSNDHNGDGVEIPTEITPTNDPKAYDVTYVPPTPGNYEVALRVTAPEENDTSRPPDSKVKVEALEGPGLKGLNPHPFVGEPQNLRVFNANPQDSLRIEVIGPNSSQVSVPTLWNHNTREFEGVFKPEKPGHHSVNVLCNSRNIKGSPFPTRVQNLPQPEFWGRGICDSLRAGEEAVVFAEYPSHILPSDAQRFLEKAKLKVKANNTEVPVKETVADNRKIFTYSPEDVCTHEVYTIFDDEVVDKHSVNAQYPSANSRAFGPGTEAGMAERKAVFVIDRAPNEEVQFAIEGPAPSELRRNDIDDKTAVVEYTPSAPGKYYVSVLDNHGQNVKDSPFAVSINETVEGFYPDRAKISDIPPIVRVNEVVEFNVDTRPAHSLVPTPSLEVYDPECEKQETRVQQKHDNTYRCSFCPRNVGHHQVFVTLDGVTIPPCPVMVACVDPDKLIYSGPGFDSPAYCSPNQTHFVIDAKQAGPGHVEVEMVDGEEQKVDVEVMDEKDGSYTVKYRAPKPGAYKIKVVFAGFELPNFEINVQQPADVSGTRVEGLDNESFVEIPPQQSDSGLTGELSEPIIVDEDDFEHVQVPKQTYSSKGEFPLPAEDSTSEGPEVTLLPPFSDASKCVATGKGLTESTVGEIAEFKVDTSEAGEGDLAFAIRGPNTETTAIDYTPGSCSAVYSPTQPGEYEIIAKFGRDDEPREHIPGSPFSMVADYPRDPSRIIVIDPASTNGNTRAAKGVKNSFIVDASQTKHLPITPVVKSLEPRDEVTSVEIEPRIWKVDYTFNEPTNRRVPIDLRYGDEVLPIGPFVEVVDSLPENLKILGITPEDANSLKRNIEFDAKDVGNFDKITGRVFDLDSRHPEFDAVVNKKEPGVYNAVAHPKKAGRYGLQLLGDGTPINDSLIEFDAIKPGDAKNAFIRSTPATWALNKPNDILIEHDGDEKSVSAVIKPNDESDIDVQTFTVDAADLYDSPILDSKLTVVRLTPKKSQLFTGKLFHELQPIRNGNVTFVPNDNPPLPSKRPGSPFSTSKRYDFALGPELAKKHIQAFLLNPDKELCPLQTDGPDANNHLKVTAVYDQLGKHVLFLLADGKLLANHVVQEIVTKPVAFAHGPGLESAIVGEKATFDIVCPDRGQVKVNVKGPKSVKIEMEQKQENSCTVYWTPDVPGTYEVLIYVNKSETPAAGSPYFVKAENPPKGRKTSCFSCAAPSEVTFDCGKDVNKENLTATVTCPDGSSTKCGVRLLDESKIGLTLCPKTVGNYKFEILERGKELPHSPFYVQVASVDLPDPSQVQLYGEGLKHAVAGVDNEFYIDCQKAGYGSVLVSIDGPADAPMSCVRTNDKVMKILYNPPVVGTYQINVNFDEKIVPSCPHFVECREPEVNVLSRHSWSGSQNQSKTVVRDDYIHQVATPQAELPQSPLKVQSPAPQSPKSQRSSVVSPVSPRSPNESSRRRAELDLFVPNSESSQLTSVVVDPRGNQLTSAVGNVGKGYHSIQFKVTERGRYTAHVYQNNHEIFGSPFSFIAGAKKHGNAENIQITGTGLEFAQAGQPQSFMIHTAEAGPGVVNVVIDGPEKPLTKLKDLRDGRVFVEYTANTPGHYFITVLFNGVSVRTTPYCVYVSPAKPSKSKKQNGSTSKVVTPTSPVADYNSQQTVSTPKSATNMAKLSGRGLTRGTTGSITEFDILPLYQGDMIYAIEVHGPSKVKLSTETTSNGIRVKFVPLAPGDYNITVKNNGVNVDESPCRCKVDGSKLGGSGVNESTVIYARYISHSSTTVTKYEKKTQPIEYIDQEVVQKTRAGSSAKNIVIDGQGMTQFAPGKPAMFKIFNIGCETLFVGVVTAHGPCQQCSVSNCGDGSFLVTYVINDRTPGFVYIRYGNEDVPGSPFKTLPASR